MVDRVDLSYFFAQYAKKWLAEFRGLVKQKRGFDGNRFSPIALSTARHTRGRGAHSRLNRTGLFRERWVRGEASDWGFRVETNEDGYPGSAETFASITEYNDAGSPDVNRAVRQPPLLFPRKQADVEKMGLYREMEDALNRALEIQLGEAAALNVRKHIKIG